MRTIMSGVDGVKALLFDVFGTVVDWRSSVIREGQQLAQRQGWPADKVDWPQFADTWRREGYTQAMRRVARGEAPWVRVDVLHRQMLDRLIEQHGLQDLDEAARDSFNRVWHRLQPWPDSVPGLIRLKRRYVISPLSNGNVALLTNMAKHAGLPWDCILSAELFGAFKPDPAVYLKAADILGLQPQEVMMVAAHRGDLEASERCGLHTAYVRRPFEHGTEPRLEDVSPNQFDFQADSFEDLAIQLGL
jgi:2-haloacid dehalogenase